MKRPTLSTLALAAILALGLAGAVQAGEPTPEAAAPTVAAGPSSSAPVDQAEAGTCTSEESFGETLTPFGSPYGSDAECETACVSYCQANNGTFRHSLYLARTPYCLCSCCPNE